MRALALVCLGVVTSSRSTEGAALGHLADLDKLLAAGILTIEAHAEALKRLEEMEGSAGGGGDSHGERDRARSDQPNSVPYTAAADPRNNAALEKLESMYVDRKAWLLFWRRTKTNAVICARDIHENTQHFSKNIFLLTIMGSSIITQPMCIRWHNS